MSLASHWAGHSVWVAIVTVDYLCPIGNPPDTNSFIKYQANVTVVVFDCPFGDVFPDLLITVNFTTLGINATFPSNAIFRAVSIVVGLTTNPLDVIHNTWPIPLVPDMHLLGGVIPTIRKQFKRPVLASLGVFSPVRPSFHVFYSHPY